MAAMAASQRGAQVALVSRAPGATALYAGGMEIAADLREMRALAGAQPYHPFVRLGINDFQVVTLLDQACYHVQTTLRRVRLRIAGSWRTTGWYADVHCGARAAPLPPAAVRAGVLRRL